MPRITAVLLDAMTSSRRQLAFLICLLAAVGFSPVAATRSPTIDELIGLQERAAPVVSPSGRFVAYTIRQPNWVENKYETQVWLVNTETGSSLQLTKSEGTNSDSAWSSDGRWLGFVSDRDGTSQVYVISPAGGATRQITNVEAGVLEFRWSPNYERIAFTTPDPVSEEIQSQKLIAPSWHIT